MSVDFAAPFREHERLLRGLCYRLTGSAADADDLVQETFLRATVLAPGKLRAVRAIGASARAS